MKRNFPIPESYHKKVDDILTQIKAEDKPVKPKRTTHRVLFAILFLCLILTGVFTFSATGTAKNGFFDSFKNSILSFLGMDEDTGEELGIQTKKESQKGKPDLMIELKEVVMDEQNLYAVVKITAPSSISFTKDMTFDYYGFCEGENYNPSSMVSGAKECTLLEVSKAHPNVATYVIRMAADTPVKEGKNVTVFFKDLIPKPAKKPEVLVEGMWSLSFVSTYTKEKSLTIRGNKTTTYSLLGVPVTIQKIKLTPLGMTMVTDVTSIPVDTLNTSDTRITIRLKMLDGSEKVVETPDANAKMLVSGSSILQYEKKGKTFRKYTAQFEKAVNPSLVLGFIIEDSTILREES